MSDNPNSPASRDAPPPDSENNNNPMPPQPPYSMPQPVPQAMPQPMPSQMQPGYQEGFQPGYQPGLEQGYQPGYQPEVQQGSQPGYPVPIEQQPVPQAPGGWMTFPQGLSSYPSGLEGLSTINQLLVHQLVELLEAFTGWETNNKYKVMSGTGQELYYAIEDTHCCTRNCCDEYRPFDMKIIDNYANER